MKHDALATNGCELLTLSNWNYILLEREIPRLLITVIVRILLQRFCIKVTCFYSVCHFLGGVKGYTSAVKVQFLQYKNKY